MEEEVTVEPTVLSAADAATPQLAASALIVAMLLCIAWQIFLWYRSRTADTSVTDPERESEPESDEPEPDEPEPDESGHESEPDEPEPDETDSEEIDSEAPTGPLGENSIPKAEGKHTIKAFRITRDDALPIARAALTGLSQAVWALPFAALLQLAASWCASRSLALVDTALLGTFSGTLFVFGLIALCRRPLIRWISHLAPQGAVPLCSLRDALALIVSAALCVIVLELPYNTAFDVMDIRWVAIEFALVLAVLVFLYFAAQRFGIGAIVGVTIFTVYGIAQHFVALFKSAPIMPSDLLALSTAMEVSSGYEYEFTDEILLALMAGAGAVCLLALVRPNRATTPRGRLVSVGVNLCLAAACLGCASSWYASVDFHKDFEFTYDYWWPLNMYMQQGSLTSFTAVAKDLPIDEPEGYSDKQAEKITNDLAQAYTAGRGSSSERAAAVEQFNQVQPTVIAIMNETFSDLSVYDGLRAGYEGPALYNSLPDALSHGSLAVSVCGGGTANSEFEFLTGTPLAFVGGGKYPYTLYNFDNVNSLVKQFSELGYATTAMHPNAPNNWNRASVYRQLGFEKFLSFDDFAGGPTFHNGITDRATYDKILQLLAENPDPQFIFDVTMQNHSGYEANNIPPEQIPSYTPEGVADAGLVSQLNVYLSCINASDQDFSYFIDQLRSIGRPVVVIFFGDHQPNFATTLNDALFPGEDAFAHSERTLQTTYTVWANYDVAGNDQLSTWDGASASTLAAQALDMIGAPLTVAQQAQLAARTSIPQLNIGGYRGTDGTWYPLEAESPYSSLLDELSRVHYLNFARAVE